MSDNVIDLAERLRLRIDAVVDVESFSDVVTCPYGPRGDVPNAEVVSLEELRRARAARQLAEDAKFSCPNTLDAARDIATHITTEDGTESRGIGLYPPPEGIAWRLTPDQADQLALSLVRSAAAARLLGGDIA